jgi:hypothetical protein
MVAVIVVICCAVARLTLNLGRPSGNGLPLSDILTRLLRADETNGISRFPELKYLEIRLQGGEPEFVIPPSIQELIVHCEDLPGANVHLRLPHGCVGSLKSLKIDDICHETNASIAASLVKTGQVPSLAHINLQESALQTEAVMGLFAACQEHLPDILQSITIDLTWRADDPLNLSGENDHLVGLAPLRSEAVHGLRALRKLALSRFLFPDYPGSTLFEGVKPYLQRQLAELQVLGAFEDEIVDLVTRHHTRRTDTWMGLLVISIDYDIDVNEAADLTEEAAQGAAVAKVIINDNMRGGKPQVKVQLRAIGGMVQQLYECCTE